MALLVDRAAGMLAGVAIGDALGMPAEFLTAEQIRARYGSIETLISPAPDHPHHLLRAGSVTDDTDHTLMLAELMLDHGQIESNQWAERLLAWSQTPRVQENRFVGPSTLRALATLQAGKPLDETPRGGTTVGAAMRVAALAIACPNPADLIEQVVASCAITHYTNRAISGAMAMAFALSETLRDSAVPDTVAHAAQEGAVVGRKYGDWSWTPAIERRIEYVMRWVRNDPEKAVLARLQDLIGVDLYPEQLVPNAIGLALLARGDPWKAMKWAANLGGDTDTLASMAGSICGGLNGLAAFGETLLAQVEAVNNLDLRATARRLVALRKGRPLLSANKRTARTIL
ncbi:MAG: ADP-ribosylglycohydrolase family protein [Caldilineaceae bacterium]|nr:ADP-ribosylglycohydrolase family protein [Caldilineaceae bacterium]